MTDNEVIDDFLQLLFKAGKKGASVSQIASVSKDQISRVEQTIIGKGLVENKTSYIAGQNLFIISHKGIDIINEYGSYLSLIDSLKESNAMQNSIQQLTTENLRLQNRQMKRSILYSIIGFISGAILTNYKELWDWLKAFIQQ